MEEDELRSLTALLLDASKDRARHVAARLLERFEAMGEVFSASREGLLSVIPGDIAAVDQIERVRETIEQVLRSRLCKRPLLSDEKDLIEYLTFTMAFSMTEKFRVLFLDARNRLILDEVVAHGCIRGAVVHPREVMRRAVEVGSTALILVHNHPSGDPTPSAADLRTTKALGAAAATIGIVLHDHLIVARAGHSSFRRLGLL